MKIDFVHTIEFLRAIVRPYLAITISSVMCGITIYLAVRFGDTEMAKYVVTAVITIGGMIAAFYFGERAKTGKEDK